MSIFSTHLFATCIGVGCSCTVLATPLAFGNYDPISGSATDSTSNVQVTCTVLVAGLNVSYVIKLSTGLGSSFTPRTMYNGLNPLNYNLYSDVARTVIWGDGTSGSNTVSDAYNLLLLTQIKNYTVYGQIPASQVAAAGVYADTITVTVEY